MQLTGGVQLHTEATRTPVRVEYCDFSCSIVAVLQFMTKLIAAFISNMI
jgi:hypothetical protein